MRTLVVTLVYAPALMFLWLSALLLASKHEIMPRDNENTSVSSNNGQNEWKNRIKDGTPRTFNIIILPYI